MLGKGRNLQVGLVTRNSKCGIQVGVFGSGASGVNFRTGGTLCNCGQNWICERPQARLRGGEGGGRGRVFWGQALL